MADMSAHLVCCHLGTSAIGGVDMTVKKVVRILIEWATCFALFFFLVLAATWVLLRIAGCL